MLNYRSLNAENNVGSQYIWYKYLSVGRSRNGMERYIFFEPGRASKQQKALIRNGFNQVLGADRGGLPQDEG